MNIQSLKDKRDEILHIAAKHGARTVRVFGSVARARQMRQAILDHVEMELAGACSIWAGLSWNSRIFWDVAWMS